MAKEWHGGLETGKTLANDKNQCFLLKNILAKSWQ